MSPAELSGEQAPQRLAVTMTSDDPNEQDLVVTLRDGSEHVVALDADTDAGHVLDDVSAGRSRLLRGWVTVRPPTGAGRSLVSGDEIIRLRLVERRL